MKKTDKKKKTDRSDKFTYKKGDLKIVTPKKVKESYSSFAEFIFEKEEKFVASTMRWITIKDEQNQNQHLLIKKKDGTILGGMGGKHNGEKLGDVFDELEDKREDLEKKEQKKKEAKPYPKTKYDEIDPPSRERFEREMRVAKKVEELYYSHGDPISEEEVHSDENRIQRKELTNKERIAIEYYTGDGYSDMNNMLRDYDKWVENSREFLRAVAINYEELEDEDDIEEYIESHLQEQEEFVQEHINELTSAMEKAETKKNMKTYRGLASNYFNDIKDKLKVGDVLEDNGFVSTSTDEDVAMKFGSYIMEVLIPKGSPATSVKHLSGIAKENEVLLKSGARFEVCEINHEKRRLVAMLTYD